MALVQRSLQLPLLLYQAIAAHEANPDACTAASDEVTWLLQVAKPPSLERRRAVLDTADAQYCGSQADNARPAMLHQHRAVASFKELHRICSAQQRRSHYKLTQCRSRSGGHGTLDNCVDVQKVFQQKAMECNLLLMAKETTVCIHARTVRSFCEDQDECEVEECIAQVDGTAPGEDPVDAQICSELDGEAVAQPLATWAQGFPAVALLPGSAMALDLRCSNNAHTVALEVGVRLPGSVTSVTVHLRIGNQSTNWNITDAVADWAGWLQAIGPPVPIGSGVQRAWLRLETAQHHDDPIELRGLRVIGCDLQNVLLTADHRQHSARPGMATTFGMDPQRMLQKQKEHILSSMFAASANPFFCLLVNCVVCLAIVSLALFWSCSEQGKVRRQLARLRSPAADRPGRHP